VSGRTLPTLYAASASDVWPDHRAERAAILIGLGAVLGGLAVTSLCVGAVRVSPLQVLAVLAQQIGLGTPWAFGDTERLVVLDIRLPRILLGALVGGGLGVSGALMQGLFRNPLADPGLVGASTGAALAAIAVLVLGTSFLQSLPEALAGAALSVGAFVGGVATVLLVYRMATRDGRTSVPTMLLAGIAVNALAAAGVGAFTILSTDQQLRDFTFWTLGSLGGVTWPRLAAGATVLVGGIAAAPLMARTLNALLLGEAEAKHLGVDLQRSKTTVVLLATLTAAAAVTLTGIIGFVGLVAPHLLRLVVGPDHRVVLPGSALLGAGLLLAADLVARTVAAPAELPIGIVTALLGAPFFLWLLLREGERAWAV
jgi:iron complex transport system permease protein